MARGSSQSQSSTSSKNSRPRIKAPRGPSAAAFDVRRSRIPGGTPTSGFGPVSGSGPSNMFRFYTDDAPGLKISPVLFLFMSFCLIGFVTALQVLEKLYLFQSGA